MFLSISSEQPKQHEQTTSDSAWGDCSPLSVWPYYINGDKLGTGPLNSRIKHGTRQRKVKVRYCSPLSMWQCLMLLGRFTHQSHRELTRKSSKYVRIYSTLPVFNYTIISPTCFLTVEWRSLTSTSSVKTKFLICPSSCVLWETPPIRSLSHLNFLPPTMSIFTWSQVLDDWDREGGAVNFSNCMQNLRNWSNNNPRNSFLNSNFPPNDESFVFWNFQVP